MLSVAAATSLQRREVIVHAPDEIQAKWEAQGLCMPGEELDEVYRLGPERQFNKTPDYEYARNRH